MSLQDKVSLKDTTDVNGSVEKFELSDDEMIMVKGGFNPFEHITLFPNCFNGRSCHSGAEEAQN